MDIIKTDTQILFQDIGVIDPEEISSYLEHDGYGALKKAIQMKPEDVVALMLESELRGRGGSGFPVGMKWKITREHEGAIKYIVCNANDLDPGDYKAKVLVEGNPHNIVESVILSGYAVGCRIGYINIPMENTLAVSRLKRAIAQAKENGFLGENILGSGFDFDIYIRVATGVFASGEETALIANLEGKRGEPHHKPPYPSAEGVNGMPTVVNNIETMANIPYVVLHGADWLKSIGCADNYGTKVFTLSGKIKKTGLVEVPLGTTIREIIFDLCGVAESTVLKGVHIGGAKGSILPIDMLDIPITYENFKKYELVIGSGGIAVMDDEDCGVELAKNYIEFALQESCGKCTACRIGLKRIDEMLENISVGKATDNDIAKLRELAEIVCDSSLCGLGRNAPNPVLSTIEHYIDDYKNHIKNGVCPAVAIKKSKYYKINPDKCIGCTACSRVCPMKCITGTVKNPHTIDVEKCVKCGACFKKCKFGAIEIKRMEVI